MSLRRSKSSIPAIEPSKSNTRDNSEKRKDLGCLYDELRLLEEEKRLTGQKLPRSWWNSRRRNRRLHELAGKIEELEAEIADVKVNAPLRGVSRYTDWASRRAQHRDNKSYSNHCDQLLIELSDAPALAVEFSRDGTKIVSSSDSRIFVWDSGDGSPLLGPVVGHTDRVRAVAFSWDGKRIVSGSNDCTVRVWDAETGEVVSTFAENTDHINTVSFSPDGRRVASGSSKGKVCIWNLETETQVFGAFGPFEGHTKAVRCVAFSNDGRQLVSGSEDCTIVIWDTESGRHLSGPFIGHTSIVNSVVFSSDDKKVVSGSADRSVCVWHSSTGELLSRPLERHAKSVRAVTFSEDNKTVLSGSNDCTVNLWDVEKGHKHDSIHLKEQHPAVTALALSADGAKVIFAYVSGLMVLWRIKNGEVEPDEKDLDADEGHFDDNLPDIWADINSVLLIFGSILPFHVIAKPNNCAYPALIDHLQKAVQRRSSIYKGLLNAYQSNLEDDWSSVFTQLRSEWTIAFGAHTGLAGVNATVYTISTESLFSIDTHSYARVVNALSGIMAACGLAFATFFHLRYQTNNVTVSKERAKDLFGGYLFFALTSRIPALLVILGVALFLVFWIMAALQNARVETISLLSILSLVLMSQYIIFVVHRTWVLAAALCVKLGAWLKTLWTMHLHVFTP